MGNESSGDRFMVEFLARNTLFRNKNLYNYSCLNNCVTHTFYNIDLNNKKRYPTQNEIPFLN